MVDLGARWAIPLNGNWDFALGSYTWYHGRTPIGFVIARGYDFGLALKRTSIIHLSGGDCMPPSHIEKIWEFFVTFKAIAWGFDLGLALPRMSMI